MVPKPAVEIPFSSPETPLPTPLVAFPAPAVTAPLSTRTSSRITYPPSYLRDYHCNLLNHSPQLSHSVLFPLSHYISYNSLSSNHKNFILQISSQYEPRFNHEVVSFPHWMTNMSEELSSMETNNTWSIVPLPTDKHSIGCQWFTRLSMRQMARWIGTKLVWLPKGIPNKLELIFLRPFHSSLSLPLLKFSCLSLLSRNGIWCSLMLTMPSLTVIFLRKYKWTYLWVIIPKSIQEQFLKSWYVVSTSLYMVLNKHIGSGIQSSHKLSLHMASPNHILIIHCSPKGLTHHLLLSWFMSMISSLRVRLNPQLIL